MATPPSTSLMRRVLTNVAKLGVVAALLYFLVEKGLISVEQTRRALEHPVETATGVGLLVICLPLGAVRWRMLLGAQGIPLTFLRALQLNMIGSFFNIALPGSVSGDLIKAYYVGHEAPGRRARAFGAILFDRVMGLSALLVVSSAAFLLPIAGADGDVRFEALRWGIRMLAAGVIAFYAYLLLVPTGKDPVRMLLVRLEPPVTTEKRSPVTAVRELYDGMRDYHGTPLTVLGAMGVSILIHVLVGLCFLSFAHAVGESWMTAAQMYATEPAGMVVTTIPVAPAGVGTGHAAFAFLFKLVGSERGADVFTLFAATQIAIGMVGGLVYLGFKRRELAS